MATFEELMQGGMNAADAGQASGSSGSSSGGGGSPNLLSMLTPALKAGVGIYQLISAAKYAKAKRPTMGIPTGVTQAEDLLKQLAYGNMPGYETQQQKILGNEATAFNRGIQAADSPAALLGYGAALNQSTNRSMQGLYDQNANFQTQGLNKLAGFQGSTKAAWQDKVWDYNQNQPYQNAMRAAAMLREGGLQNIAGAANSLTQSIGDKAMLEKMMLLA